MTSDPGRGRVLAVDDEAPLRDLYSEILTEAGYVVEVAPTGQDAIEALRRQAFDLVISDISMPGLDGLHLLRAVRERDVDLPVILITGSPSLETALRAIRDGVLLYLVKPVASSVLCEAVERGVRLSRLARLKRLALTELGAGNHLVGDRAGLEAALGRAVSSLWLAAQPIVKASDGSLFAHEVLVRSREDLLPNPGALFDAAEHLGQTAALGRAIRRLAADILARSESATLFVNVLPSDLLDEELFSRSSPLTPYARRVVLEVTERASLERVPDARNRFQQLRDAGYRLALDDLGAGYAGLSSFAALEPDVTKLDMSLIRDLDRLPVKQKLVRSLTEVCHDLGTSVVAEGVETVEEKDAAISLGCDLIQGFLIGRPQAWSATR